MSYHHKRLLRSVRSLINDLKTGDKEKVVADFEKWLVEYQEQEDVHFCDSWCFEDITIYFKKHFEDEDPLTSEEVHTIADRCERGLDNLIGMNWDVIDCHIRDVLDERRW